MTLDCIDSTGDYEPGNCRWATRKEQVDNRACSCSVEISGTRYRTLKDAANAVGIPYMTLKYRYDNGLPLLEAQIVRKEVTIGGRLFRSLNEVSKVFGVPYTTLVRRLDKGMTPEQAIKVS